METQKIVNLLGDANNESSKFATRKWYVINDQNNTDYGKGNEDNTIVKLETKVIKSNLCDYSDSYLLVTGDITETGGDANIRVAFKNCALFKRCITHINAEHVHNADSFDIIMPIYNLIEYSDNYSDTSGWDVYGNLKETNHLEQILEILTMFLLLIQHPLNTNQVFLNH